MRLDLASKRSLDLQWSKSRQPRPIEAMEDPTRADGYAYDVVIVFDRGPVWRRWAKRFQALGIECFAYASVQNDEVFVKVRAPLAVLERWAERTSPAFVNL